MSLSIWFSEDVERILRAIDETNFEACHQHNSSEVRIYRLGFAAAIRAIATAFGVVVPDTRAGLEPSQTKLVIPTALKQLAIIAEEGK